jgi:hypothetical protein
MRCKTGKCTVYGALRGLLAGLADQIADRKNEEKVTEIAGEWKAKAVEKD